MKKDVEFVGGHYDGHVLRVTLEDNGQSIRMPRVWRLHVLPELEPGSFRADDRGHVSDVQILTYKLDRRPDGSPFYKLAPEV